MKKPKFYLNLPALSKLHTQVCDCCQKEYKTAYRQQRYCNDPCMPLTAKERRLGITDAVRRGEAVAIPDKEYGVGKRIRPRATNRENESLGELSRKMLSMRL